MDLILVLFCGLNDLKCVSGNDELIQCQTANEYKHVFILYQFCMELRVFYYHTSRKGKEWKKVYERTADAGLH